VCDAGDRWRNEFVYLSPDRVTDGRAGAGSFSSMEALLLTTLSSTLMCVQWGKRRGKDLIIMMIIMMIMMLFPSDVPDDVFLLLWLMFELDLNLIPSPAAMFCSLLTL
jgi:hypothetical protein